MYQPVGESDDRQAQSLLEDMLRLQQNVYEGLQAQVHEYTGGNSPALERYYRTYQQEFQRYQSVSGFGELFTKVLASDLFYVGDYHTLRQSQEMALRLLVRAAADARPLILAIEMIQQEHQEHLDAYWRGEIDESEFLDRVHYRDTWNFQWENYRPLFYKARELGVRMVAINQHGQAGQGGIEQRDAQIADCLVSILVKHPEARLMVLIGDLHLASAHLPRAVETRLERRGLQCRRVVVHQNSDELYWDLARSGNEDDTQVVRLADDRFCVMQVPPYVKLQSYLSWEQAADGSEEDIDTLDLVDPTAHRILQKLQRHLCEFLQLPEMPPPAEVFTNLDEVFFDSIDTANFSEERQQEIHLLAFSNRSCWLPETDTAYLPYFSINHASEASMLVLLDRLSPAFASHSVPYENFYVRCLRNAFAFLASKLVNPRRVASSEREIRRFLRGAVRRLHEPQLIFRKRVARFVVQHKDFERATGAEPRGRLQQIYAEGLDIQLEVTFLLGCILGDDLAIALNDGHLDRDDLRTHLLAMEEMTPSARYFRILEQIHG